MTRLLLVLSFIVLSFIAAPLDAADLSLSGTVLDPSGAAVPGASVELQGPLGSRDTVTDGVGIFSVDNLAPGPYSVVVASPGLTPVETEVELRQNDLLAQSLFHITNI